MNLVLTLLVSGLSTFANPKYTPGTYTIDPMHSKVGFEVAHLVISTVEGRFTEFQGSIDLDSAFNKSKVNAEIQVKSINTGVEKRDDHLRSADFFDIAKYPTMTFKSSQITGTPAKFKVKGDLQMRGVTKPVTFEGKFLGAAPDAWGNLKSAFKLETKISRKDFGLTWNDMVEASPVVGDEVKIELTVQAGKPLAEKK